MQNGQRWTATEFHPIPQMIQHGSGEGGSSQYAEIKAVNMCLEETTCFIVIYADRGPVFKGLTTRMPTWKQDDWRVNGKPIWGGPEIWTDIWNQSDKQTVSIDHANAHTGLEHNDIADAMMQVNAVELSQMDETELYNLGA
ncbi:ribonuclease H-like [Mixophyes fleayi]|uniref:ribonuclease H-like n=1 Tax=Mixophyes fleayi TaxID=3061075 RepID=UPI003F4DD401